MKNGLYICNTDWRGNPTLDYKVRLKETEKSYILTLVENNTRYSTGHIEMMFGNKGKVVIPKDGRCPHCFNTVDGMDNWFCVYPGRAGIPFSFSWAGEQ